MNMLTGLCERLGLNRSKPLGARGEDVATRHLKRLGYKVVARGESSLSGELDIIAVDRRTVVFVEVKTRRSADKGHPSDAVDHAKQKRLTALALQYLHRHDLLDYESRFDVIAITWPLAAKRPQVEHLKHAFQSTTV